MLNTIKIKGIWHEKKGKLEQKIGTFIHNDFLFAEGKKEELFGILQEKYDKAKNNPLNYHSICVLEKMAVPAKPDAPLVSLTTHREKSLREEFAAIKSDHKE